jgi:hypothetical protein
MKRKKKGRKVVQAKKKVVDGIEFASTLESYMYKLLKSAGMKFSYEGQSYQTFGPFNLEEECWERATKRSKAMIDRRKVSKISYTPDFIADDESWFIEVKGRANESFPIRWKLFKQMVAKRPNPPLIFKPTNNKDCEQVLEILKSKGYGKKSK